MRIEPVTREWAAALADGDEVFADRFGTAVEPGWEGFPESREALADVAAGDRSPEWGSHLFFDDDGALVGIGGWTGPPVDGVAELGYAVAPARQGRGIATAATRRLLAAGRAAGLRAVVAHTLAHESASTSVLRRCGFSKVDEVEVAEEGAVWRWEVELAVGYRSAMAYDEVLAERVRDLLAAEPDVDERRMFGGLAFLLGGTMAVAVSGQGGLMLRCDPEEATTLLADPLASPMEMRGREMSGWLRVVDADGLEDSDLARWVDVGVSRARALPPT